MADSVSAVQSQIELFKWIKENAPEYYQAMQDSFKNAAGFADKQLDQAWRINEANNRESLKRQRMVSDASRYSADKSAKASKYSADRSYESAKYRTDAETGLGYLKTAAEMRGPADYLQQADFLRGASQRQDVPIFLQNLMQSVGGATFQAPGGAPQGATMANLVQKLGGNTAGAAAGGVSGQNASFLGTARTLAQRGFHTLAPGSLEALDPNELGVLKSAVEYSGDGGPAWSWDSLLRQYKNAGIGQGSANAG